MLDVEADNTGNVESCFLADEFCVTTRCAFDYMKIGCDDFFRYEKSAAQRHGLTSFIFHHQQDNRRESCTRNLPRIFSRFSSKGRT